MKPQAGLRNVTHMEQQLDVTHRGIAWAGGCLRSSCLGDGFPSVPMSVFSSKVNGISDIEITEYFVSALILKLKLL